MTLELVRTVSFPISVSRDSRSGTSAPLKGKARPHPPLPYKDFFVTYGGESQDRSRSVWQRPFSAHARDGWSVCAHGLHGGAMANFARAWQKNWRLDDLGHMTNCGILKFTFEDDKFYLEEAIGHDFSNWEGK